MKMTEGIFLTADKTNGLQMYNGKEVLTEEVMSEAEFIWWLKDVGDDECIGAYVSEETFAKLDKEHGIRKY